MFGFQYLAEKEKYGDNIRTGRYALNPSDNMRYLFRRLSMGYQTPINLTVQCTHRGQISAGRFAPAHD